MAAAMLWLRMASPTAAPAARIGTRVAIIAPVMVVLLLLLMEQAAPFRKIVRVRVIPHLLAGRVSVCPVV